MKAGIRAVWEGDRRAPCGELWLLENAPADLAPRSPLGEARMTMRDLLAGDPLDPLQSLSLRPEGLPTDVAAVHEELLAEIDLPADFADPWLMHWHGLLQDDREAASRLVAWAMWDPDDGRRARLREEIVVRFDVEPTCDSRDCWWVAADTLAGDAGAPGRRDALSDALWRVDAGPRAAGVAGDWVAEWRDWVDGDPLRRLRVVRPGVGDEAASALWVGGDYRGRTLLDAELLFLPKALLEPLLPPTTPSDTAGGRAAALIPW